MRALFVIALAITLTAAVFADDAAVDTSDVQHIEQREQPEQPQQQPKAFRHADATELLSAEAEAPRLEATAGYKASTPTTIGRTVLWVGFACMALSTLYFVQQAYSFEIFQRKFHYVSAGITGIAALAYLCMSLDIGVSSDEGGRSFYWARYVDWTLTTPLLLVDLGLLAGVHYNELIYVIIMDILMIVAGLIGGLYADDPYKGWPLFVFGMIVFLPIILSLTTSMKEKALSFASDVGARFNQLSVMTVLLWSAYPVVWVIAEGTKVIPVDLEIVLYAILDVSAKCLFGFILLANRSLIERATGQALAAQ
ncbi:unnamed protein product [Vitrella brassicaformis CCMP3155]|uniref:Bacteriorhodopsin n=2 Tax=Vitrella brassicaformis TaxID=1169539 RepID=A0A0G4GGE1_VITBC|nr:unnamed protein product [Vitrella brassicaformis CCMP3155]|mmetsp:Transcript_5873/g.14035  ORF Transcript_5873/g.14035 Transcript_5873/m.14035 type:complete len:310 (+) Transcript_5873:118-1047(+)|eukprot:CEM28689.1 unnamed protein product [Vitrella brassicaformis CCMP3155]